MEIGISSSCFYPMLAEESFEKVCSFGIRTAEIFFNSTEELKPPLFQKFIEIKNNYGVSVNTIHPFTAFAEPFMLFGGYERKVHECIEYYKQYFEAAEKLGAKAVIIHGGNPPQTKEKEDYYIDVFGRLCDAADDFDVLPATEIVVKRMGQNLDFLSRMKNALGERFKTVLDIKQCRRSGVSEFDFIDRFASDIIQVHISDYNEELDCIAPGEGLYDFKKLFTALQNNGYDSSAIIELYNWSYNDENQIKKSRIFLENL